MNYLYKCTNHYGVGFGARLRAPEAERLYRLCLMHSRSSSHVQLVSVRVGLLWCVKNFASVRNVHPGMRRKAQLADIIVTCM